MRGTEKDIKTVKVLIITALIECKRMKNNNRRAKDRKS